jgi:precorrin-6A synthase
LLAARHRIPLNSIGEPILLTTGRKLAEDYPAHFDRIVVLLDGGAGLDSLAGKDVDIFWGAYLGTQDEILIAGRVIDVLDDIRRVRQERRAAKGWIMDTYLLRSASRS